MTASERGIVARRYYSYRRAVDGTKDSVAQGSVEKMLTWLNRQPDITVTLKAQAAEPQPTAKPPAESPPGE